MVSWGFALTLSISVFAGITVAGMVLDSGMFRWMGIFGTALGSICLAFQLKEDVKRQREGTKKNPRVWCDQAIYVPSWIKWTMRVLLIALAVEAQFTLNKMAGLG